MKPRNGQVNNFGGTIHFAVDCTSSIKYCLITLFSIASEFDTAYTNYLGHLAVQDSRENLSSFSHTMPLTTIDASVSISHAEKNIVTLQGLWTLNVQALELIVLFTRSLHSVFWNFLMQLQHEN